jgi:hypothetical protein
MREIPEILSDVPWVSYVFTFAAVMFSWATFITNSDKAKKRRYSLAALSW